LLGLVQSGLSNKKKEIWEIILSGDVFIRLPIAFVLMLLTAGFTEEFFFRGILQSNLARKFNRQWPAILISSVLFGVYHLPYAFLKPTWSTHGIFWAAFQEGVIMTGIMGAILGFIYARTKHLVAPIICHALFDAVMVMTMWNLSLKFG
jgi:membrane protease YdiL (CAAX protease family)